MSRKELTLSVLFLQDVTNHGIYWIAQCLEYDIVAQGKSLTDARKALERTVVGQLFIDQRMGKQPFEGIGQAPAWYFKKFETAERLASPEQFTLPNNSPVEVRANDVRLIAAGV